MCLYFRTLILCCGKVRLVDEFQHPKTGQRSQCYRIVYRDMGKVLTQVPIFFIPNISAN